jgi:hypothetical protein
MTESGDPLETELSALRPHPVSTSLRRGIAAELAGPQHGPHRRRWLQTLAVGLAAACLAAVLFPWGGGDRVGPGPTVIPPPPTPGAAIGDSKPALLAYQRALARSPEDLAALLDKHAMVASGPGTGLAQIRDYPLSNQTLHTLLGED